MEAVLKQARTDGYIFFFTAVQEHAEAEGDGGGKAGAEGEREGGLGMAAASPAQGHAPPGTKSVEI